MDIRKPDAKGRVVVGTEHEAYEVTRGHDGTVTLAPIAQQEPATYKFVSPVGKGFDSFKLSTVTEYRPGVVLVTPELVGALIDAYARDHDDHVEGHVGLFLSTQAFIDFLEMLGFRRTAGESDEGSRP